MCKSLVKLLNSFVLVAKPRQNKPHCKMENSNCAEKCKKSDLIINVTKKDVRRFKAGAELSGKVNLMNVTVNEESGEDFDQIEIKLHLSSEACASAEI
jgi:hypothetical protein